MADQEGSSLSLDPSQSNPSAAPSLCDPTVVTNYIKRVGCSILEEDEQPPAMAALQATLNESQETIRKFISDPMARSLFIQKISNRGE
jgi:hypothetical protein